jgi:hypothetical protein
MEGGPWIERFRPASLSDLVAHEEIISIREFYAGAGLRPQNKRGWMVDELIRSHLINRPPHLGID